MLQQAPQTSQTHDAISFWLDWVAFCPCNAGQVPPSVSTCLSTLCLPRMCLTERCWPSDVMRVVLLSRVPYPRAP